MVEKRRNFVDYETTARQWVMYLNDGFYPEALSDACQLYGSVMRRFGQLVNGSESSQRLLLSIQDESPQWLRLQLLRVFRKFVCPVIPFESVRQRSSGWRLISEHGRSFRDIRDVQAAYESRPQPDEALCAVLWENQERGKKALDIKARFFGKFEDSFPGLTLVAPDFSGDGIRLRHVLPGLKDPDRQVDFLVREGANMRLLGWARYERDVNEPADEPALEDMLRGVSDMRQYCDDRSWDALRALVVVDGPGLLSERTWQRYADLEGHWQGRLVVTTLRMFEERVTPHWLNLPAQVASLPAMVA